MKNYVQVGRLTGAKIKYKDNNLIYEIRNREEIIIDATIVSYIENIGTIENRNFMSGFLRGFFGKFLGNTAWLSAIQSANSNMLYNLRITYCDGSRSIALVDYNVYLRFMEKF